MRPVVEEVERLREPAVLVDELDAVLLDEVAAFHFVEHAEPFEHVVSLRDERLADVEARLPLALEKRDAMTFLGDERRDRGATRPAANDDDIGFDEGTCHERILSTETDAVGWPSLRGPPRDHHVLRWASQNLGPPY